MAEPGLAPPECYEVSLALLSATVGCFLFDESVANYCLLTLVMVGGSWYA